MGIEGLVGYIHRGQNFVRHAGFNDNALPESVGFAFVHGIPSDREGFQRWLKETREMLEKVRKVVDVKDDIYPVELSRTRLAVRLDRSMSIEWTYVFDLDILTFTVNDVIHFRLDNMPPLNEWLRYIAVDGTGINVCPAPWTPDRFRADSIVYPLKMLSRIEKEGLKYYDAIAAGGNSRIEKILPSDWTKKTSQHFAVSEKLALIAAEGFIIARYSHICRTQDWEYFRSRRRFEDLAKDILTAACHGGSTFSLSEKIAQDCAKILYAESQCELYIKRRKRLNYFWFRGRLVVLTRALDDEERFKSEIGLVLKRVKAKGLSECTAVLWSIYHVAVVVVSGENISHSDPIPVAATLRPGMDEEKLAEGIKFIMHYLPLSNADGGASFSCHLPLDVVLRVMEFSDTETLKALGQTSKTLRYEWVRRPRIDEYQLLSVQEESFLATDDAGRYVDLKLEPFECLHYKNIMTWETTAWRKPMFYIADRSRLRMCPGTKVPVDDCHFAYVHGYWASVKLRSSRISTE